MSEASASVTTASKAALAPLKSWRESSPPFGERSNLPVEACTLAFFLVFWTNLAVVASRFHGVPQVVASGVVVLLVVPIAKYLVIDRQPFAITPALPFVFAFLGALFLSAALSSDPAISRGALPTYLSEGLLLYLLVSNAARGSRTLNHVVWVLILAGSLLGALSVYQELTHSYANDFGGLAQVDRLDTGGGFNIAPEGEEEKVLRPRLGGPLGSENRYAQILAVLLPLALIRVFREASRRLRLAAVGSSLLITGGLLLTFSRGAAVGVAATLLLMMLLRELRIRDFVALLAVITAVVAFVVPDYVIRLTSLQDVGAISSDPTQVSDSAILGRTTENLAAWHTFLDHPLTGVGPAVYFREYSREYANRLGLRYLQSERRGHSLYLELAADTGIIGLAGFLAMVGATLIYLHRGARYWRDRDPQRAMLASSLFFGLFAYLATAAFLHLSYQRYFWVLLALGNAVVWSLQREAEDEHLGVADRRQRIRTGLSAQEERGIA
jgi:putative inorganic carbon (hco3(-)) transporter